MFLSRSRPLSLEALWFRILWVRILGLEVIDQEKNTFNSRGFLKLTWLQRSLDLKSRKEYMCWVIGTVPTLWEISIFRSQIKKDLTGISLVIQWPRLCAPNAGAWVCSPVRESQDPSCCNLRVCMPQGSKILDRTKTQCSQKNFF